MTAGNALSEPPAVLNLKPAVIARPTGEAMPARRLVLKSGEARIALLKPA